MNKESFYIEAALNLGLISSDKFYTIDGNHTVISSTDSSVTADVTDQVISRAKYLLKLKEIRDTRDRIIKDSDWMFLTDVAIDEQTKSVWTAYRQQLRDCTNDLIEGQENEFIYPTSPLATNSI